MPVIGRMISILEKMVRKLEVLEAKKAENLLEWHIKKIRLHKSSHLKNNKEVYRGEIFWCELGENIGNEECKKRPVVIIQNQRGNDNAPTTIVAPITNATIKLPVAMPIDIENSDVTGTIDLGQIRVIHKSRLIGGKIGKLKGAEIKKMDGALMKSVGVYGYLKHEQEKFNQKDNYAKKLNQKLRRIKEELGVNNDEDIIKVIQELTKG